MTANDIYAGLGVKRRINAAGTLTRLGGALMAPEVVAAMAAAARASVDIAELQAAASRTIARLTGAEAGMVTTGAAAALTLATAASMTRWDVARMAALPHAADFPHEVIIPRTHRTGYSHAFAAAGARLIDIGHNDRGTGAGVRGIEAWEIEAAIGPRTAAFAFSANIDSVRDLPLVAEVCRARGIPVIVDAAAQLPPKANLRRFVELGADLVAFSGGKAIGGPQATGILAGRRELIASALLQQQDMDVNPLYWAPPSSLASRDQFVGIPHHGLGRGFKAGREEIVGLLAALEAFVSRDEAAWIASLNRRLKAIGDRIASATPIQARHIDHGDGRPPELHLIFGGHNGLTAFAAAEKLRAMDPAIHLAEDGMADGRLTIKLLAMPESDDAHLAESIVDLSR